MKTSNHLENLLRSWTPRGPSRKLEVRLFGAPTRPPRRATKPSWLSPMAALGFTCLVAFFNQSLTLSSTTGHLAAPTTALITNPALASSVTLASGQTKNSYRGTFEWTNLSHSLTTAAPYRPSNGRLQ